MNDPLTVALVGVLFSAANTAILALVLFVLGDLRRRIHRLENQVMENQDR